MVAYEQTFKLLQSMPIVDLDGLPLCHWKDDAGWGMSRSLNHVMASAIRAKISQSSFCAVSLDESTATDHVSYMSVHVHVLNSAWEREALFLKLHRLAVTKADAKTLAGALVEVLQSDGGMTNDDLQRKLINVSCDGASVLSGLKGGAVSKLRSLFAGFLEHIHCIGHRIDLSAHALDNLYIMQVVEELLKEVYNFFARSGARSQRLREMQPCPFVHYRLDYTCIHVNFRVDLSLSLYSNRKYAYFSGIFL